MPHLQLPPFLPMTAKANGSHSSTLPPPENKLSNRMCKTSPPAPAPLEKKTSNQTQSCCWTHVFLDLFSDLKGCSLLDPKHTILIVQRAHADTSEPICHEREAQVPCPTRTSFCAKAVTQVTDAGRILPVCGLPVQDPTLDSALRRSHLFVAGNGQSQNFHSSTPTAFRFF